MKKILMAGLAAILPAAAQTPQDLILQINQDAIRFQATPNGDRVFLLNSGAVKNAPYSADAVTETTQTLADGNKISRKTTQKQYRDSDGRERREESVLAVGALAQADAPRLITISDPVDNVTYALDPAQRMARKMPGVGVDMQMVQTLNWVNGTEATRTVRGVIMTRGGDKALELAGGDKEDLGTKNIEGVIAQGTRTTETIPAGQIGNQLPIKIVDEVWHSAELQMDVMTTHSDPRSGDVVYKLTNIDRANPARSLFEPPADYTVTGPAAGGGRGAIQVIRGRGGAVVAPK